MTQQEREEVQANWTHDRMQIIVATIAFGMGDARIYRARQFLLKSSAVLSFFVYTTRSLYLLLWNSYSFTEGSPGLCSQASTSQMCAL